MSIDTATDRRQSQPVAGGEADEAWTRRELSAIRLLLEKQIIQVRAELEVATGEMTANLRESGAGEDDIDMGAQASELWHGSQLAENTQGVLDQTVHVLERLTKGYYGRCESCSGTIDRARLEAFPRASECLPCKQHQERAARKEAG